jgi:hypothetical protein
VRNILTFPVNCEALGKEVKLETRDWWPVTNGDSELIQFRAKCSCGKEHVGSSLPHVLNAAAGRA